MIRRLRTAIGDERGSVIPLIIGYLLVVSVLLLVVIDATILFLRSRALGTTADGAALAAAQSINEAELYGGNRHIVRDLPLLEETARAAVVEYLIANDVDGRFHALQDPVVSVEGDVVSVGLTARAKLPFVNLFPEHADGVEVGQTASAVLRCNTESGACT